MNKKTLAFAIQAILLTVATHSVTAEPLTDEEILALDAQTVNQRPAADFNALTLEQVAIFPVNVLSALTPEQIATIPPEASGGFKLQQLAELTLEQFEAFSPEAISHFSEEQLIDLSSEKQTIIQEKLTQTVHYTELTAAEFAALTAEEIALIPIAVMEQLTAEQLNAITVAAATGFTAEQLAALTPQQLNALTAEVAQSLTTTQLAQLSEEQKNNLLLINAVDYLNLTTATIATLPPEHFTQITSEQIALIPADAMSGLQGEQITAISLQAVSGLTASQLAVLTEAQLSAFKMEVVEQFTDEQKQQLTEKQKQALKNAAVDDNNACPAGTDLLAKFQGGDYSFEKPKGNESIVTISDDADRSSGSWQSTVAITDIALKGGTGYHIYHYDAPATSGEFSKTDLPPHGTNQWPDISHIQFCTSEPQPTPSAEDSITLNDGSIVLISTLTVEQVSQISIEVITTLTAEQLALIPVAACSGLSAQQIAALSIQALAGFSVDQFAALSLEAIAGLTVEHVFALKSEIIMAMGIDILSVMAVSEIEQLSYQQLAWIILTDLEVSPLSHDECDDDDDDDHDDDDDDDDDDEANNGTACTKIFKLEDLLPQGWDIIEGKLTLTQEAFSALSEELKILLYQKLAWFDAQVKTYFSQVTIPYAAKVTYILTLDPTTVTQAELPQGWQIVLVGNQYKFQLTAEAVNQLTIDLLTRLTAKQLAFLESSIFELLSVEQLAAVDIKTLVNLDINYLLKLTPAKVQQLPPAFLTRLLINLDGNKLKHTFKHQFGITWISELEAFYNTFLPEEWQLKVNTEDEEVQFKFKINPEALKYVTENFMALIDFEAETPETLVEWITEIPSDALAGLTEQQLQLIPAQQLSSEIATAIFLNLDTEQLPEDLVLKFQPEQEVLKQIKLQQLNTQQLATLVNSLDDIPTETVKQLSPEAQVQVFLTLSTKLGADAEKVKLLTPPGWHIDPQTLEIDMLPEAMSALTPAVISTLSASQIKALKPESMAYWSAAQIAQITVSAIEGLTAAHIGFITLDAVAGFTALQIPHITIEAVSGFNLYQLLCLAPEAKSALTPWQRINMVRFVFTNFSAPAAQQEPPATETPSAEQPVPTQTEPPTTESEEDTVDTAPQNPDDSGVPDFTLEPVSQDFGQVNLESSADRPVLLSNISSTETRQLGSSTLVDEQGTPLAAEAEFRISNDNCSNQSLAAGESCELKVTFAPQSVSEQQIKLLVPVEAPVPGQLEMTFHAIGVTGSPTIPMPETPQDSEGAVNSPCVIKGTVDFLCNNTGQLIDNAVILPGISVSGGMLSGHIDNQGTVSQVVILPDAVVSGGNVSGYIFNQGILMDFNFVGAEIVGGTLAGTIVNNSQVGGIFKDVFLAAGTYIEGGHMQGQIQGDETAPALLEEVRIKAGSTLSHVILGQGVLLAADVTLGDGVEFLKE